MNFIIYEDEKKFREQYKKLIQKVMLPKKTYYQIIEIDNYNTEAKQKLKFLSGHKIYLLDIEVPGKNGFDLARAIRNKGDWQSQIIMITNHRKYQKMSYTSKLLMLDFISKYDENINVKLIDTLEVALEILGQKKSFIFTSSGELYQIPYHDILYIEKCLNGNDSTIVTNSDRYNVRDSINHLEEILSDDARFLKTHRSCIVNLNRIKYVDFDQNIIQFGNKKIDLISRSRRKLLKDKLKELVK